MKYVRHICLATCMFCTLICSCHSIPDWKRSKLNLDPCPEACRRMLEVVSRARSPLVLCHKDLQCGNILHCRRTGVCVCGVCVCGVCVCACVCVRACVHVCELKCMYPRHK